MYKPLIFFWFLLLSSVCFGSYDFNQSCKAAYTDAVNLRFNNARRILESEKLLNSKNDIPYLIENYIDFLTLIISEDKARYDQLKHDKELILYRLEKGDRKSPYYNYCIAEVYIQWAFVHVRFREYLTAAYELNKAYRLLLKNDELFPGFISDKKCLGLMQVLISAIPDDYKWMADVLNLKGDLKQGTENLEFVFNKSVSNPDFSYLQIESSFLLTFIYVNFWNDRSKLINLESSIINNVKAYKDSPLISYALAKIALSAGDNDKAIERLLQTAYSDESFRFSYLDYMAGVAKLNSFDNDADLFFKKYIAEYRGKAYIKSAYQKLAWFYLLKGDEQKYMDYKAMIKNEGSAITDEDKQAEKEAGSNETPNVYLLKARLLCDGGYYDRAIKAIFEVNAAEEYSEPKDYIQFTYRLARTYHDWGKISQAIPYYELTVTNGSAYKYYFAANSALHLGMIYEKQHDFIKARKYYNNCLEMKNDEYRNSIRQKAKAGLKRL